MAWPRNSWRGISPFLPLLVLFASTISACKSGSFALWGEDVCRSHYPGQQLGISSNVYETRPSPGKGLGVFASTDIPPGTPIIIEGPLLRVPMPEMVQGKGFRIGDMVSNIEAEFQNLSPSQQQEFLQLHEFRFPSEQSQSQLLTIFRSNAYNTGDDSVGLFPKIARINHSCKPNAGNYWSERKDHRIIYAMTNIDKGEEITVSYIPLLKTTEQRQARLQQYGFTCDCVACQSQGGDKRRVKIQDLLTSLEYKLFPPSKKLSMSTNERLALKAMSLTQMIEAEGLTDYLARAFHLAAIFNQRNGNLEQAMAFARRELEMHQWAEKDSSQVTDSIELIETLEHRS